MTIVDDMLTLFYKRDAALRPLMNDRWERGVEKIDVVGHINGTKGRPALVSFDHEGQRELMTGQVWLSHLKSGWRLTRRAEETLSPELAELYQNAVKEKECLS